MNTPAPTINHRLLWIFVLIPVLILACSLSTNLPISVGSQPSPETTIAVIPVQPTLAPVQTQSANLPPSTPLTTEQDDQTSLIALYKRVNPAVVNIIIYLQESNAIVASGTGSGFVYDTQGHIITNAHVVEGSDQLDVIFSTGITRPAKIVGQDYSSDLAVIQVSDMPEGIQPLPLGDIASVQVGQTVVAIGNPFGLGGSLSKGIVSALGRTIPALNTFRIPQAVQTDAAINPGNSGGPLLNLQGEVIGINAQIETGSTSRSNSGVGFAIPVSVVKRVIPSLIINGKYSWPWVGVQGGDLNPTIAKGENLNIEQGAYLDVIIQDGPAEKAGLRGSTGSVTINGRDVPTGGDVITAIDGNPVNSFDDLLIYVALSTSPGQKITLTIVRDGKTISVPVTLEPRPANLEQPGSIIP